MSTLASLREVRLCIGCAARGGSADGEVRALADLWGYCGSDDADACAGTLPCGERIRCRRPLCDSIRYPLHGSHLLAAKIASVCLFVCKVSNPSCVFRSQRNTAADTHKRHKCTQPHGLHGSAANARGRAGLTKQNENRAHPPRSRGGAGRRKNARVRDERRVGGRQRHGVRIQEARRGALRRRRRLRGRVSQSLPTPTTEHRLTRSRPSPDERVVFSSRDGGDAGRPSPDERVFLSSRDEGDAGRPSPDEWVILSSRDEGDAGRPSPDERVVLPSRDEGDAGRPSPDERVVLPSRDGGDARRACTSTPAVGWRQVRMGTPTGR